jgi:imidazoleglycerol-phosphate dehydratase
MSSTTRRTATLNRDTNETKIKIALSLDGGSLDSLSAEDGGHASQTSSAQSISINSGIGFLDHMLHALAKHSGWSLSLTCQGDLHSTTHTHNLRKLPLELL